MIPPLDSVRGQRIQSDPNSGVRPDDALFQTARRALRNPPIILDTAANWTALDPILAIGQLGVEYDTNKLKIGNGATRWTSLGYVGGSGGGAPTDAAYLVGAGNVGLSDERVVTDTPTVTWDLTGGLAKANVPDATTTTKGAVELATSGESAAGVVVQGNDARLSDARTPLEHSHTLADITDEGDLASIDLSGDATEVLRGDGSWGSAPNGTTTVKHLAEQHDIASATGTEVTGLSATLTAGTYTFTYYLFTRASNTTVGIAFGVNYTGTITRLAAFLRYADTGTTATTGVADDATAGIAEEIHGIFATITKSTTACNLGPLTNHGTANTDTLMIVEGIIVVSDSGDIELWHNSDTANTTSVMVGSALVLQKVA